VDRIEDLQAFVAIVDKGSLTATAKQLGRSLQSISRSLATLKGDLGVELIARTTRRSAATEAGLAFYRRVGAALSEGNRGFYSSFQYVTLIGGQLVLVVLASILTLCPCRHHQAPAALPRARATAGEFHL
jgi:DNA-binding transcriptional LysR family regulator